MLQNPTMQTFQTQHATGETTVVLNEHFSYFSTQAAQYQYPEEIPLDAVFKPAVVPGTVAMLSADFVPASTMDLTNLDEFDHWYRTTFTLQNNTAKKIWLKFDGLLTHAEVFLNGQPILQSNNAFHVHTIDVSTLIKTENTLNICFRAIKPFLNSKHPRPRYITRLINERHLRFIRTPVLGYTPGFAYPTKAVGPYRPISLILQDAITLHKVLVNTVLVTENTGQLKAGINFSLLDLTHDDVRATLTVTDSDTNLTTAAFNVPVINQNGSFTLITEQSIPNIEAYWPHTHGKPKRYTLQLSIQTNQQPVNVDLGYFGFKRVERIASPYFGLTLNGVAVYLRGACWTPMDAKSLLVNAALLRQRLTLLRDFGINMLRVPGNMLYESDDFYALCDELGILIFQEFAFTNFDYPESDEGFIASIVKEAEDFLYKHGNRPCLTLFSGGSEIAQQASMMGLDIDQIHNAISSRHLPDTVQRITPHIPYAISSPYNSKNLPFHTGDGPAHYFGVGGYRRSFEDARLFKGLFISECLPFSHIPEDSSLRTFWHGEILPTHHPLWKDGVTRDPGSGWDFSDITDFYVEKLFGIDTVKLRSVNLERYLQYCRAALVETVETTLSIFRADAVQGRAALVWFLHDLKQGAGWGYIDSLGKPKSAFYGLVRTAQPTTVLFVDEGLEGLALYLAHDGATAIECTLTLSLVTEDGRIFEQKQHALTLEKRSVTRHSVDTLIGHFVDSSYAYQFGPRAFTSCVVELFDQHRKLITQKIYAPTSETHTLHHDVGLSAQLVQQQNGDYALTISSQLPAYFVSIEVSEYQVSDNYFHVMPNFARSIQLKKTDAVSTPIIKIRALNSKTNGSIQRITG
jgi:beta-mannosidase